MKDDLHCPETEVKKTLKKVILMKNKNSLILATVFLLFTFSANTQQKQLAPSLDNQVGNADLLLNEIKEIVTKNEAAKATEIMDVSSSFRKSRHR
jgi:hypothetical protein